MENTRIKILENVLDSVKKEDYYRGICYQIDRELYNYQIDRELYSYGYDYGYGYVNNFKSWFRKQKPTNKLHSKFTKHSHFTNTLWWWTKTVEGKEQRILFLEHLIKKERKLNLTKV